MHVYVWLSLLRMSQAVLAHLTHTHMHFSHFLCIFFCRQTSVGTSDPLKLVAPSALVSSPPATELHPLQQSYHTAATPVAPPALASPPRVPPPQLQQNCNTAATPALASPPRLPPTLDEHGPHLSPPPDGTPSSRSDTGEHALAHWQPRRQEKEGGGVTLWGGGVVEHRVPSDTGENALAHEQLRRQEKAAAATALQQAVEHEMAQEEEARRRAIAMKHIAQQEVCMCPYTTTCACVLILLYSSTRDV
jgi:hypothetical protein